MVVAIIEVGLVPTFFFFFFQCLWPIDITYLSNPGLVFSFFFLFVFKGINRVIYKQEVITRHAM